MKLLRLPKPSSNNLSNHLLLDVETPRSNRAKLDTGTFCNYDCEFCYYKDQLSVKTSIDVVKQRADYLLAYGITQVDLSGGESSVSPDWFDILDYCNERFEHISCLTHGGRFANINFLKESQEHGLKEVLFSLHGASADIHDSITNRAGSFDRILTAISNAQQLGIVVRINCTVYYKNYKQMRDQYVDLINRIAPLEVNFITLNYWHDAVDFENVSYLEMTNSIKACIDGLDKSIIINVRYVPYCYMEGYEKYVCNQYQHIYDIYDWNKELYGETIDTTREYSDIEKLELAYAECAKQRVQFYHKDLSCTTCKHFYICDGVEKEIAGTTLTPMPGDKIHQVNFYRKDHFK